VAKAFNAYMYSNISPQVYHSEGPGHSYRWNKRSCGVVCFVKDNLKRSYFIRLYDMDNHLLVFEQEIYNQLKWVLINSFHTVDEMV